MVFAARNGYICLFDLLVEKYGIRLEVKDLITAVLGGQTAMIDHLVVKLGSTRRRQMPCAMLGMSVSSSFVTWSRCMESTCV